MVRTRMTWILRIAILIGVSGCNDRVTQVAREAADRQAQQNDVMAELHQEVASGTRELVAADAKARSDIVGVHHDLQSERVRLDGGWEALENERRQIANQRRTESVLAPLVPLLGVTVLAILLLGFCWYAVGSAHSSESRDFRMEDLLVREILLDEPQVLGGSQEQLTWPNPRDERPR